MKIIIAITFYFLYWGVCFLGTGTDKKNLIGLRSYPQEVQNRVREDPSLGKLFRRQNPPLPFCSAIFSFSQSCFPFWGLL